MEDPGSREMPTYGIRPWFVIVFGLLGLASLVMGIVTDANESTRIGLTAGTWMLAAIALFIASLGSAMVSLLIFISRR